MILHHLRLHAFRAHAETRLDLAPEVNLLFGPNGAGKTNVLEAVHFLCLTKSFVTAQDQYAVRAGSSHFEIEGRFEGERRPELQVKLVFVPEEGKRIFVNRAPLDRLSDIVGMLPVVVFSPGDHALTTGGPDERRRFLNNTLSQAHPVYLDDLLNYRRALQQRNALLLAYRRNRRDRDSVLASWDTELVRLGSRIIVGRMRFIQEFSGFLRTAYELIEAVGEEPTIEYVSVTRLPDEADEAAIAERFARKVSDVAFREREQGRTLVGPHRDELIFRLNDFEVRRYASRGQHRTFGMALKLATYFYLQENLGEHPILLLDDVFGDLDVRRTEIFLRLLQSDAVGQSLITAADPVLFDRIVSFDDPRNRSHHIREGGLVQESP